MKRRLFALGFLVLLALPSFARVLSSAPYTDRNATPGFQLRTTRYFVLVESFDTTNEGKRHQVVLYDSEGQHDPRVVYPADGTSAYVVAAALHESSAGSGTNPQLLVIGAPSHENVLQTSVSADGGRTWKVVPEATRTPYWGTDDPDFGGPYVQGLSTKIRTGTDRWPFVVEYPFDGVRAIDSNGATKKIGTGTTWLLGQDRSGGRALIGNGAFLEVHDLDSTTGEPLQRYPRGEYYYSSGWITNDGSAYIQVVRLGGRYLFRLQGNTRTFIAGPYDQPEPEAGFQNDRVPPEEFFAVPTHDFEGAWMIQRRAGRPTTLLRHTAQGLQTVAKDPSGPAVESLIAGASGQTLLLQVRRERFTKDWPPLVHPAFVLFHVGEAMGRAYDELLVAQEDDNGFVHVDVDRLGEGEPFVFHSGATRYESIGDPPSPRNGEVAQESGVVRSSLRQHLVLPGVARLHGANGSRWMTDVTLHNPSAVAQNVEIRFLPSGQTPGAATQKQMIALAPKESRFVVDVLHAIFGIEGGGGALHVIPAGDGIKMVGRTYTSRAEDHGTYGFAMEAIDLFEAVGPRNPVTFAGAFAGSGHRTNVLITDPSQRGAAVSLESHGSELASDPRAEILETPAGAIVQLNELQTRLGLGEDEAGALTIRPTRGSALTTVVTIDNQTNDATYFPPDLPSTERVRVIPLVHRSGSRFRSEVYLFNPTDLPSTVTLEAKLWTALEQKSVQFTLQPNETLVIPDILGHLQMEGLAQLRYSTGTEDGARVTSRSYRIEEDGATHGTLIPPLDAFQVAAGGDRLEVLGLPAAGTFPVVGLVEVSPEGEQETVSTSADVRFFDQNNTQLGEVRRVDFYPGTGRLLPASPPQTARVTIDVTGGGRIGAYIMIADDLTNDTMYLGARLAIPQP